MIFNTYFPAPTGSIFGKESFDKVRGSEVTLRMGDKEEQRIPAKVLDIIVNEDGTGAHFTFEIAGEIHYRIGPSLSDLITVEFKE